MATRKSTSWLPTLCIFVGGMLIWGSTLLSLYAID